MSKEQPASPVVSIRERVKSPPAQAMVDSYFRPSVEAGIRYQFEAEMRIHAAHAVMLAECGIVDRQSIARILAVLCELKKTGVTALKIDDQQEDLYSYIERYLVEQLGPEIGGRLHTGRSRNDLHTTSWRLALRAYVLELLDIVGQLRATLIDVAARHIYTVMPGYTHTQHAQPISFGYYLLSASDLIGRDFHRLSEALSCCDRSPLGSGALSTTGFPIDRERTANLLGFAQLVEIAYDGVSIRDDLHEVNAALAIMMTGVSRMATDLQNWNTMEFGFIELDDAYSSVSSIMPQKKNPQALEHVKAVAAMTIGTLNMALAASKNTALADVNDGVTAANAPTMDIVGRTTRALRVLDGAIQTLTVKAEAMRRSAEIGFGTATELADIIVRETGMSFRMAHNVVGRVVRETIEAGRIATDISSTNLDDACEALFGHKLSIAEVEIRKALNPMENLKSRTVTGGPAPVRMEEMILHRKAALNADLTGIGSVRKRISDAQEKLNAEVEKILTASGLNVLPHSTRENHGAS
ncbi:argininosuccinate lyase [Thalassospira mesophila]|uniref:argininosuccinate lyase n=1 Tax=Thalassospira mesophila TaxID=1293891 RepID=UPI000A1DA38B|nr:argininosuccinate lyase [Thalassospira mesophila]